MSSISSFLTSRRFKFPSLVIWCSLVIISLSIKSSQSVEIVPAIVNGTDANLNDFPFVVSIRRFGTHYCGGSIINPRFILTAGHCLFNQTNQTIDVLVGTSQLDSPRGQVFTIEDIRVHENYKYVTDEIALNDIGVLKLNQPITYGVDTKPVVLSRIPANAVRRAIVVGWGRRQFSEGPSNRLQELTVSPINNNYCQRLVSPGRTINKGNLCTLPIKGRGACYGDSGTPLLDQSNNNQIGLLAWVYGTCATEKPDGYTRISRFINWIENATSDEN